MAETEKAKQSLELAHSRVERMVTRLNLSSDAAEDVVVAIHALAEVTYFVGEAIVEQLAAPKKQS